MWPFHRKPRPPVHVGPNSVDWRPGDMAECVEHGQTPPFPEIGAKLMVSEVRYGRALEANAKLFGLCFVGWGSRWAFDVRCFRKIVLTDTGADRKVGKRKPAKADA